MKKQVALALLIFFLFGIPLFYTPNVKANELETFPYDSVFWDDWNETGTGSYAWNEENSTMRFSATRANPTYVIERGLDIDTDSNREDFEYFYRYSNYTSGSIAGLSWWNTSYLYRKCHNITGSTDGAVTDYQIDFNIYYGSGVDAGNDIYLSSHSQTDFDDVRFIKSDQTTIFDFWIENKTDSVSIDVWVEIDSILASPAVTTIWIYYGCTTATDKSNGVATFPFYDNFEGSSLNTTKWSENSAPTVTVSNSIVKVQSTGNLWQSIDSRSYANLQNFAWRSNSSLTLDLDYQVVGMLVNLGAGHDGIYFYWLSLSRERSYTADDGSETWTALTMGDSNFHLYEITTDGTDAKFYWDGSLRATHNTDMPDENMNVTIHVYKSGTFIQTDWVLIREFTTNEPTNTATCTEETNQNYNYGVMRIVYDAGSVLRNIQLKHNYTHLEFSYYQWNSTQAFHTESFSSLHTNYDSYLRVYMEVNALDRTVDLSVTNFTNDVIISESFYTESVPFRLTDIQFGVYAYSYDIDVSETNMELVWVDAPFNKVSGLKHWDNTGLDETLGDTSYSHYYDGSNKVSKIKCMPFQGVKFQWNWTGLSASGAIHSQVDIQWFTENGTPIGGLMGGINFRLYRAPMAGARKLEVDMGDYSVTVTNLAENDSINIAVWVEKSGKVFAYIQTNPHSSDITDFWIYEVSPSQVDLNLWGIEFRFTGSGDGVGDNTKIKEVEFFYGIREGISQPRFGGMWWTYNPLLVMFINFVIMIQTALAGIIIPLATAISTGLAPILGAITSAITAMYTWLADITNIWAVVVSLVSDVVAEFVATFILPMWTHFVNNVLTPFWTWLTSNFFTQVIQIAWLTKVFIDTFLGIISNFLYGDPTIIPNGFWNVVTMINYFFAVAYTGLIEVALLISVGIGLIFGLPVVAMPFANTATSIITTILYYVITYLPIVVFMHMLLSLLRSVSSQSIEPFIEMILIYVTIAKVIIDVIMYVINFILGVLQTIGGFIPFT